MDGNSTPCSPIVSPDTGRSSSQPSTLVRPVRMQRWAGTGEAMPEKILDASTVAARVRVLAEIAGHYDELVDPLKGPSGERGSGDATPEMPATYTPTVREFERLKLELRAAEPRLHWHLVAYHIRVQRVQKWLPRAVKRRNKKTEWVLQPTIQVHRHEDADWRTAWLALAWIALRWDLRTEPMRWTEPHTHQARATRLAPA